MFNEPSLQDRGSTSSLRAAFVSIMSGFFIVGSKFLSFVRRARMVSTGDNGVYTGSGLRGVIPYIQCADAVFLSQMCS
jgi:hypothetical protein